MSASNTSSLLAAQRYANALIELAEEGGVLDKIEADLKDLSAMIADSSDLSQVILSPLNNQESLTKAMNALTDQAKFNKTTQNFIGVLINNRRLSALPKIIEAFNVALDARRGTITANVEVAQDLSEKQKTALESALKKAIGKNISVNLSVKPAIMGGMIVTIGSKMIDHSVRRKLERLKVSMGASSNENSQLKQVS